MARPTKNPRRYIKLRSWKVTISTKGDIPEEVVQKYYEYVFSNPNIEMHYTVVERGETGRKHLHGLVCLKDGKPSAYLQNYIWRHFVQPYVDDSHIGKIAVRLDVNADDRWISEYLKKEQAVEIISNEYDVGRESEFYPTDGEQQTLKAFVDAASAVDPYYAEHAAFYEQFVMALPGHKYSIFRHVSTSALAERYFNNRMYVLKDMKVIRDPRVVHQMARALHRYATGDDLLDFEDRKYHASLDGPVMDFRG